MIAYDLKCLNGHQFEGWFDGAKAFEKQQKKGLVTCPVCGSAEVERLFSPFGIARHRHNDAPAELPNPLELMARYVTDNFEDVGSDFAKEALKMHYGVADHRNIRGVSSEQEENTLREEGVEFFKLPVTKQTGRNNN